VSRWNTPDGFHTDFEVVLVGPSGEKMDILSPSEAPRQSADRAMDRMSQSMFADRGTTGRSKHPPVNRRLKRSRKAKGKRL
jgi:hypothetical protein